jgi:hypothetical protein
MILPRTGPDDPPDPPLWLIILFGFVVGVGISALILWVAF